MKPTRYELPSLDERISKSGREQCAVIERQRQDMFDQMAGLLRQEDPQNQNGQTLEKLIDNWAQAEVDDIAGLKAKTQIEQLLKRHHDLGEDLMDVVADNLLCDDS